jgi:putative transposase
VIDALTMAWFRRKPAPRLIHHSDRGSQYASHAFRARMKAYGMTCSMSWKGTSWDNAPTESFFNSFRNKRVHGTRYETRAEAIADTFDYIEPFYAPQEVPLGDNHRRRHSTLDYASPQSYLMNWIKRQHEDEWAA